MIKPGIAMPEHDPAKLFHDPHAEPDPPQVSAWRPRPGQLILISQPAERRPAPPRTVTSR